MRGAFTLAEDTNWITYTSSYVETSQIFETHSHAALEWWNLRPSYLVISEEDSGSFMRKSCAFAAAGVTGAVAAAVARGIRPVYR